MPMYVHKYVAMFIMYIMYNANGQMVRNRFTLTLLI